MPPAARSAAIEWAMAMFLCGALLPTANAKGWRKVHLVKLGAICIPPQHVLVTVVSYNNLARRPDAEMGDHVLRKTRNRNDLRDLPSERWLKEVIYGPE